MVECCKELLEVVVVKKPNEWLEKVKEKVPILTVISYFSLQVRSGFFVTTVTHLESDTKFHGKYNWELQFI